MGLGMVTEGGFDAVKNHKNSFFLLLGLHAANVRDFALDGLNGLELIHRLDVHGDGKLRIQLQNFRQQFVGELRGQNLQVGHGPPIAAHPESAAVPEIKAARGDIVLRPQPGLGDVLPRKAERLMAAGVHLAVEQGQPIPPVKGEGLNAQPMEVAHHIGLHAFQTGAGLGHALGRQAKGDVLCALNAVVALGNLIFQHPGKFLSDAVVLILGGRDIDLVAAAVTGSAVDKGKLERQGAVKVIEERAPAAENGRLILGGCHGIVDVLVFHGFRVKAAGELAHAVRVHRHIGDGLLGRQSGPAFSGPSGAALGFSFCLQ